MRISKEDMPSIDVVGMLYFALKIIAKIEGACYFREFCCRGKTAAREKYEKV